MGQSDRRAVRFTGCSSVLPCICGLHDASVIVCYLHYKSHGEAIMEAQRSPTAIVLTVLAYVVSTFAVQGASHFAINTAHYAAIPIMRTDPVIPMGIASMVIQGLIFAMLFPTFARGD